MPDVRWRAACIQSSMESRGALSPCQLGESSWQRRSRPASAPAAGTRTVGSRQGSASRSGQEVVEGQEEVEGRLWRRLAASQH